MNHIFLYAEKNAVILLWIFIIVVLLDIIVRLITRKRKTNIKQGGIVGKTEKALLSLQNQESIAYVLVQKKNWVPVYVSENMSSLFGMSAERVFTDLHTIYRGLSSGDKTSLQQLLHNWDKTEPLRFEAGWQMAEKTLQCRFQCLTKADTPYILMVMQDISDEKQQMDRLQQEIIETRQSEEAKTVFLSNMSHEIRTPLNGMLGMIGLTKMNLQDTKQAEDYLEKAEELSQFLLSVINDILDMSRIESGKTELEQIPFDIREIGQKLDSMFKTTLADKGIHFKMELLEIREPYVMGDQLRITQVLTNFLSNSSKFTPQGGQVTLSIRQMDMTEERSSWMFRVSDTGKGMSPEFLHRIFKPFEQEDSGITRKYGGSGLGMAIADSLVKLMGGQILVESELGKGTTFTVFVKLPIAEKSQVASSIQEEEKDNIVDLSGKRILLAEDQPVNAMIVVKTLAAKSNMIVEVAKNGLEAVSMFTAHKEKYYDVILMDIHMPEMNGWDATKHIRNSGNPQAKSIPIFALSADAFVEDKRKSIEAGMNGHITKPIDFTELINKLQSTLKEDVNA